MNRVLLVLLGFHVRVAKSPQSKGVVGRVSSEPYLMALSHSLTIAHADKYFNINHTQYQMLLVLYVHGAVQACIAEKLTGLMN